MKSIYKQLKKTVFLIHFKSYSPHYEDEKDEKNILGIINYAQCLSNNLYLYSPYHSLTLF